jgi:hypothetical protein
MIGKKKLYAALFGAYAFFTVVLAGAELNWASAVGYNIVPLVISFFILNKAPTLKSFLGRGAIAILLYAVLNAIAVRERYLVNYATIYTSCFEKNEAVAQILNEDDKFEFCTCFSNEVVEFAMMKDAFVFYGLNLNSEIKQSAHANNFLNKSFMQCAASVQ